MKIYGLGCKGEKYFLGACKYFTIIHCLTERNMTESNTNIRELQLQIARYGNEQAFSGLFRLLYDRLLRFLHAICLFQGSGGRNSVWRVCKDLEPAERTHEYCQPGSISFRSGYKITPSNYLQQYSSLRVAPIDTGLSQLSGPMDPEKEMEWKEMRQKLDQEVNRLPDQCRKVFKLITERL